MTGVTLFEVFVVQTNKRANKKQRFQNKTYIHQAKERKEEIKEIMVHKKEMKEKSYYTISWALSSKMKNATNEQNTKRKIGYNNRKKKQQ